MLKVLVADDESIVREGFSHYICWKDFDLELVACCKNGEEAFDAYKQLKPDIVITDIQMPKMDGLGLAREIRRIDNSTVIIFLSAYSEFEYAQKALKYSIFDYMLKPLDIYVFKSTITKAVELRKRNIDKQNSGFILLKDDELEDYSIRFRASIKEEENTLLQAIQLNGEALAIQAFNSLWEKINANKFPLSYIIRWLFEFIIVLSHSSLFFSKNIQNLFHGLDPWTELSMLKDEKDAYNWMLNAIVNICTFINKNTIDNKIIRTALDMISENYNDKELSLNYISKKLYISPNYLSALFKDEVGKNFSDYLTSYRIEKAKILLKDLSIKVYEVSDRIGYSDPHYFSKFFKANTGLTPKEYRNKLLE